MTIPALAIVSYALPQARKAAPSGGVRSSFGNTWRDAVRLEWGAHWIALAAEKINRNLPMTWHYIVATLLPPSNNINDLKRDNAPQL